MSDQEIDELKELVRQNIKISQDTNRVVHSMRRSATLKSLFWFLVLCLSVGTSIYTYFYFFQPRVEQVKSIYQKDIMPLQGLGNTVKNALQSFKMSTTTKGE